MIFKTRLSGDLPAKGALPSLACIAATELDNLILGRCTILSAVSQLAAEITKRIQPAKAPHGVDRQLYNPQTVCVLRRAINQAFGISLTTIPELVTQACEIVANLEGISDGISHDTPTTERMRRFCLVLSKLSWAL